MRLSSDLPIAEELRDPELREETVAAQIRIGVPFQLRAMRETRGWTQEMMACKLGTTQNTISRLENPKTGKPTIKTLLRIARVFDVGLLVRFVPFSFYGEVIEAMNPTHVEVPSYDEEVAEQEAFVAKTNIWAIKDSNGAAALGDKLTVRDVIDRVPPPCSNNQNIAVANVGGNQAQQMGVTNGNSPTETIAVISQRFPAICQSTARSQASDLRGMAA